MKQTQKLGSLIVEAMTYKATLESSYNAAKEFEKEAYKTVRMFEALYNQHGEDEEIGQKLDVAYDLHYEATEATREAFDKVDAIIEAIEAMQSAWNTLEGLGL